MNDSLLALTESAMGLLQTVHRHPSPFPPPPSSSPTPSAHLAAARALNEQLRQQLTQLHITAVARRKASEIQQQQQREDPRDRQARLEKRLDEIRAAVAEEQGNERIRKGVVNAINHSYTINMSLARSATSSASARDLELPALLAKRDNLALSLLGLQKETADLQRSRAGARRKMLVLNRTNAGLAQELKASSESAEVEKRVVESMERDERRKWDKIKATTIRQVSGHAIIRNVFQLVVVESGVEWYSPEAAAALTSLSSADIANGAGGPMDTSRLLSLMLAAGDGVEREWDAPPSQSGADVNGANGTPKGRKTGPGSRGGKGSRGGRGSSTPRGGGGKGRGRGKPKKADSVGA